MALEGGGGTSNLVRAGGAFVEIVAKDNTKPGLDSAKRSVEKASKETKAAAAPAAQAQLNTEAVKAQELARRGAALTLAHRTAAEKFRDTQKELNSLLAAGAINQLTFGRATKAAAADLAAAVKVVGAGDSGVGTALGKFGLAKAGIGGGEVAGKLLGGGKLLGLAAAAALGVSATSTTLSNAATFADLEFAASQRGEGQRLSRERLEADLGGFPGLQRLAGRRFNEAAEAEDRHARENARNLVTVGGFQLFDQRNLPLGIGEALGRGAAEARAKFEMLAASADELAEELRTEKIQFALSVKQFADATAVIGLNAGQAELETMRRQGRPPDEIETRRKQIRERERSIAGVAGRDLGRSFDLQAATVGLAPEVTAIAALADRLRHDQNLSPAEIGAALSQAVAGGEAAIRARSAQADRDLVEEDARRRADEKALADLASPLRDSAFRGQLGITGGYDYGGGGQWQMGVKSALDNQLETARQDLALAQQRTRLTDQMAKALEQLNRFRP